MLDLSLLRGLEVQKPEKQTRTRGANKLPDTGQIRITASGGIYYSPAFRQKLEFKDETGEVVGLNFLDFVDGRLINFGDKKVPFLFIAIVPMGSPKASIQGRDGKVAFIENRLKQLLTELYQVNWEEKSYVDIDILFDRKVAGNIFYIPRVNKKGEPDDVRRENVEMYPCIPTSVLEEQPEQPKQVETEIELI
jgi:hypothetical protein